MVDNVTFPVEDEMTQVADKAGKTFTGRHMLATMIAFFGVIIAVNFTMAFLASSSWTGLIVKNGYVASMDFNDKLAAAREQKSRGWQARPAYLDGVLSLHLVDQTGSPVVLENLQATYGRPVSSAQDRIAALNYAGNGLYRVEQRLESGLWQLAFDGISASGPYRLELRIQVDAQGKGTLQ